VDENGPVSDTSPTDRGRRRLLWWGGAGALVVVLIAMAGWLAWTASRARSELLAARAELPAVLRHIADLYIAFDLTDQCFISLTSHFKYLTMQVQYFC
jgi:hypothetical protein